jgi:hypothetical protein
MKAPAGHAKELINLVSHVQLKFIIAGRISKLLGTALALCAFDVSGRPQSEQRFDVMLLATLANSDTFHD